MKNNKKFMYVRWILLAAFLILITVQAYLHQALGAYKAASIHALCPFGGLESLYSLFSTGDFIKKIFSGTLILFIITIILAIAFRRSFCGLICPFGALQEFFGMIGKKLFKKKLVLPKYIDSPLRYLKYIVLFVTVYYAWKTAGLWMSPYDPWSAYAHLSGGLTELLEESLISFIILIVILVGSLLYDRFFCKYLCPMGALYGIIGKISPSKIERNEENCINCGLCSKKCPVNIDVAHSKQITSAECLNCQQCVLSCPKAGALESKFGKKTVRPIAVITLAIAVFFGGIFISQAAGIYKVKNEPVKQGEILTTSEIKGSISLKDLAKGLNIELKDLYTRLELPESIPSETKLKDIQKYIDGYTPEVARELLGQTK